MKATTKISYWLFCTLSSLAYGQKADPDKVMNVYNVLGAYRYANVEPEQDQLLALKNESSKEIKFISSLILDAFERPESLLSEKYLILPDSSSLRSVYILNALYDQSFKLNESQQRKLIDSLQVKEISQPDYVHSYYSVLFALAGKRIKPFDLSTVDIDLKKCVSNDTIGQTILFLDLMSACMANVKAVPGAEETSILKGLEAELNQYPTFNTKPFYEMVDFPNTDFQVNFYQGIGLSGFYKEKLTAYFILVFGYYTEVKKALGESVANENIWLKTALHLPELYSFLNTPMQQAMTEINSALNATDNK